MAEGKASAIAAIDRELLIGRHRAGYLLLSLAPSRTAASLSVELSLRAPSSQSWYPIAAIPLAGQQASRYLGVHWVG